MATITLHNTKFETYIKYAEIKKAIDNVAKQVNADYRGSKDIPVVLCVLNGALMFTGELMKRFKFECELATIRLSSYSGTESTGLTRKILGLKTSLKGRRVLVIEDIVDTGHTIKDLRRMLDEEGATEVKICTLLLKPAIFRNESKIDYVALEIDPKFIVGFGLDYNETGRNYKDIYVLK